MRIKKKLLEIMDAKCALERLSGNSSEQSGKQSCVNLLGSSNVFKLKPKLLWSEL